MKETTEVREEDEDKLEFHIQRAHTKAKVEEKLEHSENISLSHNESSLIKQKKEDADWRVRHREILLEGDWNKQLDKNYFLHEVNFDKDL